jgi:hypothetical protein
MVSLGVHSLAVRAPRHQVEPTRRPSILDFLAIAASLPNWPGTNVPLPAAPRGVSGGAGGGAGGHADAYSEAGPAHTAVDSTGGDGAEEEEGGDGWSTYQHACQHTYRRHGLSHLGGRFIDLQSEEHVVTLRSKRLTCIILWITFRRGLVECTRACIHRPAPARPVAFLSSL